MTGLTDAWDWLTVFRLSLYASELNPVESVWSVLKRSQANPAKRDICQLITLVKPGSKGCSTAAASSRASSLEPGSTSRPSATLAIEDRYLAQSTSCDSNRRTGRWPRHKATGIGHYAVSERPFVGASGHPRMIW
jgi:hypothetical protein